MLIVIENISPAVSPRVVAHIFITQKAIVISGNFFITFYFRTNVAKELEEILNFTAYKYLI